MDTNSMSCPTCSHTVSNAAGACSYCGATMVEEVQQPPDDDKNIGEKTQVAESPPPLPHEEMPPSDIISDEIDEIPLVATAPSKSDVAQQAADSPAPAETLEPATEAEILSAAGEKQDIQEPEGGTTPAADIVIPIARKEVQTETATDDIDNQSPPEPEVVELAGYEIGESETLGETIAELIEIEASRQGPESPLSLEKSPSPEKFVGEPETMPVENLQSKNAIENTVDAKAGSTSESLEDTILLDLNDYVEPVAGQLPDTVIEPAKSESSAEAQKINRQKADLAKAQALKKQAAALAKAQAQKKQKLILAKAAALKHKKAAQAKVQADIEAAKRDVSAVAAAVKPRLNTGMTANAGMQILLEKYKGRVIGINYDNSAEIREAQLVEANAEYFSVFVKDQKLHYSYPLNAILTIIEGQDGVDIRSSKQSKKFIAVIKVYPLLLF